MKLLHYQVDGEICRFIYGLPSGSKHLVTVTNSYGMRDFLMYSEAEAIEPHEDIYDYLNAPDYVNS